MQGCQISCFEDGTYCADVLSDPEARRLYNQYGAAGMARHGGAAAGAGNSRQAWDEFKVRRSPCTCLPCGALNGSGQ